MRFFKIQLFEKTAFATNYAIGPAANDATVNRLTPAEALSGFKHSDTMQQGAWLQKVYASKLNTLRFIAICSIVWGHCLVGWEQQQFSTTQSIVANAVLMQFGRIGTIIFFIISGFFLANKVYTYSIWKYIRHRFRSVILPWLLFVFACVCLQLLQQFSISQLLHLPPYRTLPVAARLLNAAIFHAAYWFIPVSLISACVLIAAKKYINSVPLAATLAAIAVFYSLNLYYGWVSVNHTKAFLGYAFFMWLGLQLRWNIVIANGFITCINWRWLNPILVAAFAFSCIEAVHLANIGCIDPFASIRLTNMIFSVMLFIFFIKGKSIYRIKKIKPQKYVYGVYLIHSLVLLKAMPLMLQFVKKSGLYNSIAAMAGVQALFFAVVLIVSYTASVVIKKSKFRFLTGR